ncbi:hypothetical protein [Ralstonia insidiosa]|uniref:hypothetical protein n=1 Tax=Ralstonia insidiosa TaxID=190721 RepID=UPI001427D017|nr:hypothetical protein [Ralstonia insidiosa]
MSHLRGILRRDTAVPQHLQKAPNFSPGVLAVSHWRGAVVKQQLDPAQDGLHLQLVWRQADKEIEAHVVQFCPIFRAGKIAERQPIILSEIFRCDIRQREYGMRAFEERLRRFVQCAQALNIAINDGLTLLFRCLRTGQLC